MNKQNNLLDAATNKIIDKIEKNNRLRKEIINYTNNFREYKLLKTDIVERLLENENDLRQLNIIVKSLTNQSNLQKEKIFSLENDLKNTQEQLTLTLEKKEEMEKINESIKFENDEKDIFIHELLTKLNFLEGVVRDYQTKIYISKYDKKFSYKSPFINDENFKKFYDKFIPKDYKYPFFLLNNNSNSNSRSLISKKFEGSPEILDKLKKEHVKNIMKNRSRSNNDLLFENNSNSNSNSNLKNSPSISPEEKKNINSSLNKYFSLNGINLKNRNSINNINSKFRMSQRSKLNNIDQNNNQYSSINLNDNINNNNKNDFEININNLNINNNKNNNILRNNSVELDKDEAYRKIVISSNGFKSTGAESNFNNNNNYTQKLFYESNTNNFNEDKSNINIDFNNKNINNNLNNNDNNSPTIKNSPEKERANFVSNLLLKIFSKSHVLRILKRKFGENFEIKLTDKEVDPNFLLILEEEVDELLKKEKQKEFMVNERMEANRSKKKIRPSFIRSISPPNENSGNRKAFNNYTKNVSGYFDPKYQYGGESKVPSTTRSRSNSSTGFSPNFGRREIALRNSFIDFTSNNRQSLGAGSVINDLISCIDK
jgi:hypothetical protein